MKCSNCDKEFNLAMSSCGAGYSWSLFKCPYCGQLHAHGMMPKEVEKDPSIICERYSMSHQTIAIGRKGDTVLIR